MVADTGELRWWLRGFGDHVEVQSPAAMRSEFKEQSRSLHELIERNMRSPGPYTKEYEPEGSKGYFFGDYCNWARIPEYRDFVLHSPAAEMAARLMDSSTARFFHEHVLVKEPQTESRTCRSTWRRAFAHRWVGDDVRFRVRGGEVSPPFPEAHRRLRDGDPLDDPEFPLVWPAKS